MSFSRINIEDIHVIIDILIKKKKKGKILPTMEILTKAFLLRQFSSMDEHGLVPGAKLII